MYETLDRFTQEFLPLLQHAANLVANLLGAVVEGHVACHVKDGYIAD